MSVKVENLEKNMAKLTVEVSAEEFEKAMDAAYNKQKKNITIPGFRKGHAPKAMIEKMYGPSVFYEDAIDVILDKTYPDAAKESGLEIVSRPEVSIEKIEKGQPFVYTATVAVKPEVELGEYKGVKAEKVDTTVSAKEVDARLKSIQDQNARIITVEDDRKIKKNDIVTIDFDGYVDGKQFEGGKGEDYPLTIGSHQFIDTFEDQLIGHKNGDELDVNVTFPEEYHAKELAGKPAVFKVKVKEIKVKELPELDDEFASEVSEFETMKEFKADLKKQLKADKEKWAQQQNENNVVKAVVDNCKCDVPAPMIENQIDHMVNDYARRMQSQGIPLEQYLSITGMTMEDLRKNMSAQAEATIRTRLVLEAIVKAENIVTTDEQIDEEIGRMAENYKMEKEQIRTLLDQSQIDTMKLDLACQKAVDFLVENAELTAPKKEKKEKKEADKEEA
ncbi:MAG: trigger factor [Eubacteriales bacterium]|nr:trigger factor [Eubacteriales bacterium]